jgi:RND family efflux transporter MFP subunit
MHNKKIIKYIILCCMAILSGSTNGFGEENKQPPPAAISAHVLTVRETTAQPQVELVATIQPVLQATVAAKVTGTITELPVILGSRVKKGDLLLKISADEISARVMQAKAQLDQARRNYTREKKLLRKNATTAETVKSMQDMLAVAKASFREAKTMLNYTSITAPFDGIITKKLVNSGDLATPGTPLLRLENDTNLQAVTAIPESLVSLMKTGDDLDIHVPSAHLTTTGQIAEIAPAADPMTRTSEVKIDLRHDPALRSGQFARITLPIDSAPTLLIPQSAVVPFGQMDKVFVLEDGRAQLRLVRTGATSGDQVEILAGIRPGDTIIVDNNALLVSGQTVTAD